MARVFKMTYGAAGRQTPKFYGEFRDLLGRVRRVALSENERESANALDNLTDCLARAKRRRLVKREVIDPLVRKAFHKALRAAGHPDAVAEHTDKPLLIHLGEFERQLAASGGRKGGPAAKMHVDAVVSRIKAALDECGFVWPGDIRIDKAKRFLSGLQVSSATRVKYAQAVKQFTKWLANEGRIEADPLAVMERGESERERDRRAFSVDECQRLIGAAQGTTDEPSPIRQGMPGAERAVLYTLALEAGLRRNELRTLTWIAFALDADQPTVTIAATNSKHRERDVLPLKASTVRLLRAWRDSMDANGPKGPGIPEHGPLRANVQAGQRRPRGGTRGMAGRGRVGS